MDKKDVYAELALMLSTDFRAGKGIISPEFDKIIRMQYTPEEAALALALGVEGGKLSEIARRTGKKKLICAHPSKVPFGPELSVLSHF